MNKNKVAQVFLVFAFLVAVVGGLLAAGTYLLADTVEIVTPETVGAKFDPPGAKVIGFFQNDEMIVFLIDVYDTEALEANNTELLAQSAQLIANSEEFSTPVTKGFVFVWSAGGDAYAETDCEWGNDYVANPKLLDTKCLFIPYPESQQFPLPKDQLFND